nr:ankyrin repeat-containing protein ITN1-like [Ziziphus jujuba var. spinosa]
MSDEIKDLDLYQTEESCVIDALFLAVEGGNVEFVESMLQANPLLEEIVDESCRNVFMRAIQFRQPKIFSLIYNSNSKLPATTATAFQKNNMLHIAAMLPPKRLLNRFSGAALQMQRELQWFQEVKSIVPPWALDRKNLLEEMTPGELFTEEHKQLVIEGEKWMKETARSCTVVGALIITITFAATFTVPGGYNEDSGFPSLWEKKWSRNFLISDSLSLFSSTTSVLMFLGILTSRYAEEDFLKSLPRKLMIGLFTLFFFIVSMMVAFCATLLIELGDKYTWISILVFSLALIPVTLFGLLHFSLLADLFQSTHGSMFDKKVKIKK